MLAAKCHNAKTLFSCCLCSKGQPADHTFIQKHQYSEYEDKKKKTNHKTVTHRFECH